MRMVDIILSQLNLSEYVVKKKAGDPILLNSTFATDMPTSLTGFTDENSLFVINERSRLDQFEFYRRPLFDGMEFRYHWQNNESAGFRKFAPLLIFRAVFYALYVVCSYKVGMRKAFLYSYFVLRRLSSVSLDSQILVGKKYVFITNFYNNLPLIYFIKSKNPDITIVEVQHGIIPINHKGYDRETILYSPDYVVVNSYDCIPSINLDTKFVVSRGLRRSFSLTSKCSSRTVVVLTKSCWEIELVKAFDLIGPSHVYIKPHPRVSVEVIAKYLTKIGRENFDFLHVNEFSLSDKIYSGNSTLGFELLEEGIPVEFLVD